MLCQSVVPLTRVAKAGLCAKSLAALAYMSGICFVMRSSDIDGCLRCVKDVRGQRLQSKTQSNHQSRVNSLKYTSSIPPPTTWLKLALSSSLRSSCCWTLVMSALRFPDRTRLAMLRRTSLRSLICPSAGLPFSNPSVSFSSSGRPQCW